MRRHFLFALIFGTAMTVTAQSALDLVSRAQLRQQRLVMKQETKGNAKSMRLKGITPAPEANVFGMVKLADGCSTDELTAEGVNVMRSSHGFAWVSVPVNDVERIASLKSVKRFQLARKVKTKNDNARAVSGVDMIHAGTGLPQAYTGKGVICGIVDNGIDPNHINFRDENGKSRVAWLAKMTPNMSTGEVDEKYYSNNPSEIVGGKDITTFTTDDATTFHGSHTLGTMAGGYMGKTTVATGDRLTGATISDMANPYYGMAYNSDIAVGCGDLYDAIIAYGVDHILEYAAYKGKPSVINLSLGSNTGAHDGKGMINQYFDAVAKQDNAIICVSAGNEGDRKIALHKTFTATDNTVQSFILGQDMSEYGYGFLSYGNIEMYSNDETTLTIQAVVYNKSRGRVAQRFPLTIDINNPGYGQYWVSSASYQQDATDIIDPIFANYFNGYVGIGWLYDEDSGRFNAILDYFAENNEEKNADGNYVLGFIIEGQEGQRVDCFGDGLFSSMTNFGIDGWDDGMYNGTINDMATGNSILVVGSYDTRKDWAALDGGVYYPGYEISDGGISDFSSYGTLLDGRNLPHVCAPGAVVISSYNSYYVESGYAPVSSVTAQADEGGRSNYWGWSIGTSMAAPHVAGSIALWLEADPSLTINDVKDIVAQTAVKDEAVLTADPVQAGAGKFSAYEGLKEVIRRGTTGIGCITADKPRMLITAVGNKMFSVFMGGATDIDAVVYDLAGNKQLQSKKHGDEAVVDMSSLSKGMYILTVNGHASQKIAIQ
ncbi:MAG: S8 family peptidase [Prevotella sp.]|nr:S8 family peptidase [Prevotella sp.]